MRLLLTLLTATSILFWSGCSSEARKMKKKHDTKRNFQKKNEPITLKTIDGKEIIVTPKEKDLYFQAMKIKLF